MSCIKPLCKERKNEYQMSVHMLTVARAQTHRFWHENPFHRDLFPEHEAAAVWGTVTLSYSGMEQAMKCLLRMRSRPVEKTHAVGELFRDLAPAEQEALRISFKEYRLLHDYIPMKTVDCFLGSIDRGYRQWRYILTEKKSAPPTHPGAMLEIWSALCDILKARALPDHGLQTILGRIRRQLCGDIHKAWNDDIDLDLGAPYVHVQEMDGWYDKFRNNRIEACAELIHHQAQGTVEDFGLSPNLQRVLEQGLARFQDRLEKVPDQDFLHFVARAQRGDTEWTIER